VYEDEETFYHGKPLGKIGVENNSDYDECDGKKSAMPSLEFVGFQIEHEETLNNSSGNEGSTGDASLPCDGAKIC
jgi:hypothetical protein